MTDPTNLFHPRPRKERSKPRLQLDVTLDAAQRALVDRPPGRALLVLGEAGYGKTTVAAWRLARLYREHTGARPFRAVAVVPNEALRDLLQTMLVRMGVDVPARLYETWARSRARRAFVDVPKKRSRDLSPAAARIKRARALLPVLRELATRSPARFEEDDDRTRVEDERATTADLLHLFGDRELVERVAKSAEPPIGRHGIDELLEHTHVQYDRTFEDAHAHVDKRRLVAVDRRALDEGTPTADAGSIDAEDYAVLFELDRLRAECMHEPAKTTGRYDAIVIDEAQELAPLELRLIGRSVKPGGSLVVAGDANQQLDPASSFVDWKTSLADLGHEDAETATLEVGYRCPPNVTTFARSVVTKGAPLARTVPIVTTESLADSARILARELGVLLEADERITIGIVSREQKTARLLHELLAPNLPNRLVVGEPLGRGATIVTTTVADVRGVEMDTVVVADANASAYADEPLARRALYVASTRARHELVVMSSGKMSPILR